MNQVVGITQVDILSSGRVLVRFDDGKIAIHTSTALYATSIEESEFWQKCQEESQRAEDEYPQSACAGDIAITNEFSEASVSR